MPVKINVYNRETDSLVGTAYFNNEPFIHYGKYTLTFDDGLHPQYTYDTRRFYHEEVAE